MDRSTLVIIATLAAAAASGPSARGQTCGLEETSFIAPGNITATSPVSTGIMVCGQGRGVRVVATSNPGSPASGGWVSVGAPVVELVSDGIWAYALTRTAVIQIDPNPFGPTIESAVYGGDHPFSPPPRLAPLASADALVVAPNVYYVAEAGRMHVIDRDSGYTVSLVVNNSADLAVAAGRVWTNSSRSVSRFGPLGATTPEGGSIYNFNLPGTVFVDSINGIVGSGDYLYVIVNRDTNPDQLRVLHVNADHTLSQLSSLDLPWSDFARPEMAVHENRLYIPVPAGVGMINITNPGAPSYFGIMGMSSPLQISVVPQRDLAYIAMGDQGMRLMGVGSIPLLLGQYRPAPANVTDTDEDGGNLMLADGGGSLWVYNITDPVDPTLQGRVDVAIADGHTARVSGAFNIGYITNGTGITKVSTANPASPVVLGSFQVPGGGTVYDVVTTGSRLYAAGASTLFVYGLSTPDNPTLLGSIPLLSAFHWRSQLAVAQDRVYLPTVGGVEVINAANGAAPVRVTTIANPTDQALMDVSVSTGFAGIEYAAVLSGRDTGNGWLLTVRMFGRSLFPPPAPPYALISTVNESGSGDFFGGRVALNGDRLLLTERDWISAYDYSHPTTPLFADFLSPDGWSPMSVQSVRMPGSAAYLALGDSGLVTLARPASYGPVLGILDVEPGFPCRGQTVTMTIPAHGSPAPSSFAWSVYDQAAHTYVALADGPTGHGSTISGSHTAVLTIQGAQQADQGSYLVEVVGACGTETEGAGLALQVCCPADFNHDGVANSQDFFDFLTAFFAAAPAADFNGDGLINSQDFFDFLTAFFAGC